MTIRFPFPHPRLAAVFLAVAALSAAGGHAVPDDPADTRPLQTGDRIPDVGLRDLSGDSVRLRGLLESGPAVLVFYRGGWCPYCTRHLASLRSVTEDLRALGVGLYAISPDRPEKLRSTRQEKDLPYALLSDSPAEAIRAFGLAFRVPDSLVAKYKSEYDIDLEADSGATHHLLPVPAVYLVGADGEILYQYHNADYKVRFDADRLLTTAKSLFQ